MHALCYVQYGDGIGHFVRTHTIAAELAAHHETVLVDGGAPVPRPATDAEPRRLARSELVAGARELRPDVVLIEHYPFSKWDLDAELDALIEAVRAANPDVHVVCSLRDIPPRARHLPSAPVYDDEVVERLARSFDAVLVHTDPRALRLEDGFPAADRIPVPVHYTGIVVAPEMQPAATAPHAVASAHGPDAVRFLSETVDAVTALCTTGAIPAVALHVFAPLDAAEGELAPWREAPGVVVHEFTPEYGAFLAGSAFALSRGGYNTVAESLRAGVPAVVVPRWDTDDERPRAAALAAFGADVVVVGADDPNVDARALSEAIVTATTPGRAIRTPDLTGAPTTRAILESLVSD